MVHAAAVVGTAICAQDKDDLVKTVTEHYDEVAAWMTELRHAADFAETLRDVIKGAEVRLAVAVAVVEGHNDGGPDDGGGETVAA